MFGRPVPEQVRSKLTWRTRSRTNACSSSLKLAARRGRHVSALRMGTPGTRRGGGHQGTPCRRPRSRRDHGDQSIRFGESRAEGASILGARWYGDRRHLQVIQQADGPMPKRWRRRSGSISHFRLVMEALPAMIGPATPEAAASWGFLGGFVRGTARRSSRGRCTRGWRNRFRISTVDRCGHLDGSKPAPSCSAEIAREDGRDCLPGVRRIVINSEPS